MQLKFRNPKYNRFGTIDVEVDHPALGVIPFTASPEDPEETGRKLYADIIASGVQIAPYVPEE